MDALPIPEAARLCGVAPREIREWIDQGALGAVMRGGRRHVPLEELARAGLIDEPHAEAATDALEEPDLESLKRELDELRRRVERLEEERPPASMRDALTPLFEGPRRTGRRGPRLRRP